MAIDLFFPRYSQEVPKSAVSGTLEGPNLAFVHVPDLDPSGPGGNVSIVDSSFRFPENTTLFADNVVEFSANLGINDTSNILLTNKYSNTIDLVNLTPLNRTISVRPLWYQYSFLPGFPMLPNPNGTFTVTILDNSGNEVSPDHISLDPSNSRIYTDISNTLDTWYQVVYLTNGGQVSKLLSAEPVFKRVSAFSPGLNNPEYIAQYDPFVNRFQIRTQADPSITFSMLTIGTTKINVKYPIAAAETDPWYLQIANGYFKRFVGQSVYEYGVPEYFTQAFNPSLPLNYQINETPIFMDNNLIRLRQVPLAPVGAVTNDIVIYIRYSRERSDTANYLIQAAGNQADPVPYSGNTLSTIWYRLSIEDIDRTTGIIRINGVIAPDGTLMNAIPNDNVIYKSDQLVAFYYYQELDLVYNKISLNPILDRSLLTNGISVYISPVRANVYDSNLAAYTLYSSTVTINHLLFDKNERIVASSDPLAPIGITLDEFYMLSSAAILQTGVPLITADRTTFLELARVFVRNTAVIRDITDSNLVDTRIEGGRLIDVLPPEIIDIINTNTHDMYYLRDWDGVVLPINSVVVIKIPSYLLNDNFEQSGTMLTGDDLFRRMIDIRRTCKKHLAAGVLPVVRFYNNSTGAIQYQLNPPLDRIYF